MDVGDRLLRGAERTTRRALGSIVDARLQALAGIVTVGGYGATGTLRRRRPLWPPAPRRARRRRFTGVRIADEAPSHSPSAAARQRGC